MLWNIVPLLLVPILIILTVNAVHWMWRYRTASPFRPVPVPEEPPIGAATFGGSFRRSDGWVRSKKSWIAIGHDELTINVGLVRTECYTVARDDVVVRLGRVQFVFRAVLFFSAAHGFESAIAFVPLSAGDRERVAAALEAEGWIESGAARGW